MPRFAVVVISLQAVSSILWADTGARLPAADALIPAATQGADDHSSGADAAVARVTDRIRAEVPACPAAASASAAERFVEDVRLHRPEALDLLAAGNFPAEWESSLLRQVALQLTTPAQAPLREELARRRVRAVLAQEADGPDAADLIEKLRGTSSVYYRRLLEGRMEDEDLLPLLRRARSGASSAAVGAAAAVAARTRELSAQEIAAEFARRNQVGSSLQRLRAYKVEARLKTATGAEQQLTIFRLRPNRFRLQVSAAGLTLHLLASNGQLFWQQVADRAPQRIPPESLGTSKYLSEFVDPLFADGGYTFERLADGLIGDRKTYRIVVRRADGSHYVSHIDQENFHQLACEYEGGLKSQFSDFREVAGVTIAFREETVDAQGRTGVLVTQQFTPNPGLVSDFFEPAAQGGLNYFTVERLLQGAPLAVEASAK